MIIAKWYQRARRPRVHRLLQELEASQYWPLERIRAYQLRKLSALLAHAYANVPYYREMFDGVGAVPADIRTLDDLARLPILTKDIIRARLGNLIATNVAGESLIPNSTGGSTGRPLQFYQDAGYKLWADAARIRGWYNIAGCDLGDTCAVLWGAVRDVKDDFSPWERARDLMSNGTVNLNAFNLSDERKETFRRWCERLRPRLLRGYVSAVKDYARFLEERHLSFPPLKGIILGAEAVDPEDQRIIERVFGAPSFNTYGGRELSLMAMECAHKAGLHEVSENNYIEFEPIDIDGVENAGNLIVTNLNNRAMPFLRYRIEDVGIPGDAGTCPCGRGLPRIERVIGRTTEVLVFHDGTRIAGEMFVHMMRDFPLEAYQFVQTSDRSIRLRVGGGGGIPEGLRDSIRSAYAKLLPPGVTLEFEEVGEVDGFARTASGKFRFVFRDPNAREQDVNA